MVGAYLDASGIAHGFVREPGGTYRTFNIPGVPYTHAWGVNNRGQVVGFTTDDLSIPAAS